MAEQRTRILGWCEPSAYCRKHDGTQLTGSPLVACHTRTTRDGKQRSVTETQGGVAENGQVRSHLRLDQPDLPIFQAGTTAP